MFQRSWVQIPAPYTSWTLFTFICCKNCNCLFEKTKVNKKRPGLAHFFKNKSAFVLENYVQSYVHN